MKHPVCRLTFLTMLLLVSQATFAQTPAGEILSHPKESALDDAMLVEMKKQHVVGAAIGVIQKGEIVYLKGYGLADRETKTPVSTKTVLNWASNCKPLAAVVAMQLVEKKQLDLDSDVRHYVPEFPDKGVVITVRQLLCHQSGIPHYANGEIISTPCQYSTDHPYMDPVVSLDQFNRSPLLFIPGEKSSYSSYAYILLSAVIQRAAKRPFEDLIQERIAKPLGMHSLQLDVEFTHQKNWSAGYEKAKNGDINLAADEANYWKHGAGGLKSDIGDFARWAKALINCSLVSEQTEKQMWTPQPTSDGKPTKTGLGFTIEDQGGLKVSHNGEQREVATRMVLYPRSKSGVVVMCNCGFANPGAFSTDIFTILNQK